VRPALAQYEDGPPLDRGFSFPTGDTVFFSFQIRGYQVSSGSNIDLRVRIDAADPEAVPIVKTIERAIPHATFRPRQGLDAHRAGFRSTSAARFAGTYHIRIVVEDALSKQEARTEIGFAVQASASIPAKRSLPGVSASCVERTTATHCFRRSTAPAIPFGRASRSPVSGTARTIAWM